MKNNKEVNQPVFDLKQEVIHSIDATPNDGYALRILQTYLDNCNCMFSSSSNDIEHETDPFCKMMNDMQDKRAKLLNDAIKKLLK